MYRVIRNVAGSLTFVPHRFRKIAERGNWDLILPTEKLTHFIFGWYAWWETLIVIKVVVVTNYIGR